MEDFEKNRIEYVNRLEEQVSHLRRQYDEVKPLADKWTPQAASQLNIKDGVARITFIFGGKRVTAVLTDTALKQGDVTSVTSNVIDTVCETLVKDALRQIIQPEVEKMQAASRGIAGAGQW